MFGEGFGVLPDRKWKLGNIGETWFVGDTVNLGIGQGYITTTPIQLAVAGLKAKYDESNGYEGRMLSGKPAQNSSDQFRSQAEVVRAMQDPRYDNDPAYRQDIYDKLERSNLKF